MPTSDFVARCCALCCARCCAMGCYRHPLAALLATAVILIATPFAAVAADPPLPGLHWFAPVLAGGGYCSEANALLHGLKSLPPGEAPPLRVTHHGDAIDYFFYSGLPEDYARELDSMLTARQPRARDSVIVCHSEPGAWAPAKYETARCPPEGYGRRHAVRVIGRTMFETDRLDREHVARCNKMDEVWVPTRWSAEVFERCGVDPRKIRVVPEAVDVTMFDPARFEGREMSLAHVGERVVGPRLDGEDGYVGVGATRTIKFLSVFKWEARKAPDVLLDAYFSEFTAEDDVALFLRCNLYHESDPRAIHKRVRDAARTAFRSGKSAAEGWGAPKGTRVDDAIARFAPRVFVLPAVSEEGVPAMYAGADALVLPSRGEGWGRPHVEAMAMGLALVATNWSGPTEFMTEDNSYPVAVEPDLVPLPPDSHFATHMWSQPSVGHLRARMREVASDPEVASAKGARARRDMVTRFSPAAVARVVVNELGRIAREDAGGGRGDDAHEGARDEL